MSRVETGFRQLDSLRPIYRYLIYNKKLSMTKNSTNKASKERSAAPKRPTGNSARKPAPKRSPKVPKADLEQLFESAPEAIVLLHATGRVLRVNQEFTRLFGYSQEEALNRDIDELVTPDDRRQAARDLTKQVLKGGQVDLETSRRRKDGTLVEVSVVAIPANADDGRTSVYVFYRDVTKRKRAEEALRKNEQKYRKIFENVQDVFYQTDMQGRLLEISPSIERYSGFNRAELIGMQVAELYAFPEDRAKLLQELAKHGEVADIEVRLRNKDKLLVYASVNAHLLLGRDGSPCGVEGSLRDITERKLKEAESSRLASALKSVSEAVVITDMEDNILFFNDAFLRTYGYDEEELIGKNIEIVRSQNNPPAVVREILPATLKSGWTGELLNRRKDGTEFPIHLSTSVVRDENGVPVALIGVAVDITERRHAEEALRHSEAMFRDLYDEAPVGYHEIDVHGRIRRVNHAELEMLGYAAEEMLGRYAWEFVHESKAARHAIAEKISGARPLVPFERTFIRKDGSLVPVLLQDRLLRNAAGQVIGLRTAVQDITDRKRIEEALQESEKRLHRAKETAEAASRTKSAFLAHMSHEIRTPMNAIIGMAELLGETPLTSEQQEYLRIFTRAGETLLLLINDILDLSKVEAGQLELDNTDFELRDLVERTGEFLSNRAHAKSLDLNCHIKPDVPTFLVGDPNRLRQILVNLLGNALKFTAKGEITLRVENDPAAAEPGSLLFSVSDTGIGIPSDKLDAIFESFKQVDSSLTRRYEGSGLGLTISKRLVELMGGHIWVESTPGQGSVFYFTADFGVQTQPALPIVASSVDLRGVRVLVVDDNATNRLILIETLSSWGALVTEAAGGSDALAKLRDARESSYPYRLVLLDGRMPGMDGFQVAEAINREMGGSGLTVLMLTSDNRTEGIARCRKLGLAGYLIKPVKRADLLDAINRAFAAAGPMAAEPAAAVTSTTDTERPIRILLAEDNEDNRLLVLSYLKRYPFQVDIAENGEIAVRKFTSGSYDLVLMDMQMPIVDGYSATRAIRKWENENEIKPTPVLALTAYALKEEARKSAEAGCTAHLTKPIQKAALLESIRQHTGIRPENHG
ncbi:MAG TPA: PAS domain S-box protein [Acidobacteriota bacterium]